MGSDGELSSAGISPGREPSAVGTVLQSSHVNHGTSASPSTSLPRSTVPTRSNRGAHHHYHPDRLQHDNHNDHTTEDCHQPHLHHGRLTMPDAWTRSTSYSGPLSLSEVHASGLDPTGAPPIGAAKPSHRNPYQYWQSHPQLVSSGLQRSTSGNRLQKPSGEPPFSPPFLHPLSHRTHLSRTHSPLPASEQRSRDSQRPRAKFTIGSSRPNSPMEPESKPRCAPTPFPSPFTIRGFLALSTFSKVVAILFAFCFFVLARAFFGVGHNPERCGACALKATNPGSRPGPASGRFGEGVDTNGPRFHTKDRMVPDRGGGDEQVRVWMERFEEMYGHRYGWKAGEYEVVHDDDGDDEYEHEYERDDFLGPA